MGEQVFARLLAPFRDHVTQIGREIRRRLIGIQFGLVGDIVHIHGHHAVGPVEQLRRHFRRQPDHFGNHDGRDRRGEGLDQINALLAFEPIDDLVRQLPDARTQLLHLPRHESTVHQRPQPRMGRRLQVQQRKFLCQIEVRHMRLGLGQPDLFAARYMQDIPPEPPVAQQGADRFEIGKAPMPILFPEKGRVAGILARIKGVGVLIEVRILRRCTGTEMRRNAGDRLDLDNGGHGLGAVFLSVGQT